MAVPVVASNTSAVSDNQSSIVAMVASELIDVYAIEGTNHLKSIQIVPSSDYFAHIQEISRSSGGATIEVSSTGACAIPVELGQRLECHIVITDDHVRGIDVRLPRSSNLVSTLLEEILHVRLYSIRFQQQGFVQAYHSAMSVSRIPLITLATKIVEEYLVGRVKVSVLAMNTLIDTPYGRSNCLITDPTDLAVKMRQASVNYSDIVERRVLGTLNIERGRQEMELWALRDVFEPLAYSFGKLHAIESTFPGELASLRAQGIFNPPDPSAFYTASVKQSWEEILSCCQFALDSDFSSLGLDIQRAADTLERFLAAHGLHYKSVHIEGKEVLWVNFVPVR